MTIALIDGDICAYRVAASCGITKERTEELPLGIAISRLDELCYRILSETQADEYRLYLSGSENFRKIIYPGYKDNRRNIIPPTWLDACREFLVREWGAEITAGYEADDSLGMASTEQTIICTIDKDLRQVPGQHYNFVAQTFDYISSQQAAYNYWSQVLQGDRADNIRGVPGVGPVKADKILRGVPEEEMEACVYGCYDSRQRFVLNCRLLKVLRSEQEYRDVLSDIEKGKYENSLRESERAEITADRSAEDS
jgi:hypothetical protein